MDGYDCPENGGYWMDVKWRREGSDQQLFGVQNKYPGCYDTFDDKGRKNGVRITCKVEPT